MSAVVQLVTCVACDGKGYRNDLRNALRSANAPRCRPCKGTGVRPATDKQKSKKKPTSPECNICNDARYMCSECGRPDGDCRCLDGPAELNPCTCTLTLRSLLDQRWGVK